MYTDDPFLRSPSLIAGRYKTLGWWVRHPCHAAASHGSMWLASSSQVPHSGNLSGKFFASETFQFFLYFRNTLLNYTSLCWHKGHNTLPRGILHAWNKWREKAWETCVSAADNSTWCAAEDSWHSALSAFGVSYIRRVLIPQTAWGWGDASMVLSPCTHVYQKLTFTGFPQHPHCAFQHQVSVQSS
jgi:hypothetical protein